MPVERTASCHVANTLFSTLQLIWLILRLRMPKVIFFFGKKLQRSLVWLPELEKRLGRKIRKKTGKSSTEAHFYYYSHPWRSQKPLKNVLRICDLVSDKKYQKYFDGTSQFNDPSFLLYRFNNLKRFKPNKKKLINK